MAFSSAYAHGSPPVAVATTASSPRMCHAVDRHKTKGSYGFESMK
jgi:hypothetical protein